LPIPISMSTQVSSSGLSDTLHKSPAQKREIQ
jgi:hypothetical protein